MSLCPRKAQNVPDVGGYVAGLELHESRGKITTALTMVANERIVVPERAINGGFDCKWASDPYNVKLYDIMTSQDYEDAITRVNDTVKPSRSKKIDAVLLFTGPLMVPLAIWGVRHSGQVKKRKKLLKVAIEEFNATHPDLLMRYNRSPQSCLTIEHRVEGVTHPPPPYPSAQQSDVIVVAEPVLQTSYANYTQATYAEPPIIQHAENIV